MPSPHEGTVFPEDLGSDWGDGLRHEVWFQRHRGIGRWRGAGPASGRFGPVVSSFFCGYEMMFNFFWPSWSSCFSSCTNCGYSSKKIDHCCNTTWHLCSVAALPFCLAVLCWWTMVLAQVEKAQLQELVAPPKKSWFTVWSSVVMCKSFEFINCWRWQ